jgi:long-chain acyl-CoA synthetase
VHQAVFEGEDTPARVFRKRCREWADRPALRRKHHGLWQGWTWTEYEDQVRACALAMRALGLRSGDVACVLAENRPEWLVADMAAQCLGVIGNGIYPTASPQQVRHVLADSGTRLLFVEGQEQLEKVLEVRDQCPQLQSIVVMERRGLRTLRVEAVTFWDDFIAGGRALAAEPAQRQAFEAAIDATRPEDVAFLVYTSGTTGLPKGAMVLNRNVVFQMGLATHYVGTRPGDRSLSFLPLCHIAERMSSVYNPLALGLVVHFPENGGTVVQDLREVRPHLLFAPPRFWEKLHAQVEIFMRDAIAPARWAYHRALAAGRAVADARLQGRPAALTPLPARLLQWAGLSNVRAFLGLQEVRTALTGAAPVPPDLVRWYLAAGVELREGYGMTETTGFVSACRQGRLRAGSAGEVAPGTQVRIGAGSEVLVRGAHVFGGYWNLPERTREAIDAEGWLHTGDCGELDADGCLAITGRIKDILITSGGKNIAPTAIESLLKFSPYITDAVVIGEARHYLTCLVMIDQDHAARWAQERQVPYTDFASLARAPEVQALIREEVERANAQLARVEQVKDFRIIDELLTAHDEELTPTMKLKRQVIARKYAHLVDAMYPG